MLNSSRSTRPRKGLSSAEAAARLAKFGRNAIVAKTESRWKKLATYFWGPLPWMIEAAALISLLRRDWSDFVVVGGLLDLQRGGRLLAGLTRPRMRSMR